MRIQFTFARRPTHHGYLHFHFSRVTKNKIKYINSNDNNYIFPSSLAHFGWPRQELRLGRCAYCELRDLIKFKSVFIDITIIYHSASRASMIRTILDDNCIYEFDSASMEMIRSFIHKSQCAHIAIIKLQKIVIALSCGSVAHTHTPDSPANYYCIDSVYAFDERPPIPTSRCAKLEACHRNYHNQADSLLFIHFDATLWRIYGQQLSFNLSLVLVTFFAGIFIVRCNYQNWRRRKRSEPYDRSSSATGIVHPLQTYRNHDRVRATLSQSLKGLEEQANENIEKWAVIDAINANRLCHTRKSIN